MWLANFPYSGFLVWVPTIFATVYHFSLARSITYSLAVTGCGFVGRAWSIWLIGRFGRRPVIALFAVLTGVMALAFGAVQSEAALLITACLFQFCMDTAFLGINVYTPEVFPTRIRASGASWPTVWAASGGPSRPSSWGSFWVRTCTGWSGASCA